MLRSTTGDSHDKQNRFQKTTFSTDSFVFDASDGGFSTKSGSPPKWASWSELYTTLPKRVPKFGKRFFEGRHNTSAT